MQSVSAAGRDPQIGVAASGGAVIAWTALDPLTGAAGVEARGRSPEGVLSAVQTVSAAGHDPRLGVDGDGDAVLAWQEPGGADVLIRARGRSANGTLSEVQTVSAPGDSAGAHELSVDANGNAAFVWRREDGSGTDPGLCCRPIESRSRSPAGALNTIQALSASGANTSAPAVSVDSDGGPDRGAPDALAAWSGPDGASAGCCLRVRVAKQVACDAFTSPSGSDAGSGSSSAPFASVQRLADTLSPGETGCVRAGTYREDVTATRGGVFGFRLTLRSYPGERAKLLGRLWITDGADFLTLSSLDLDGSTAPSCPTGTTCSILPSPTVDGDYVSFWGNDVTNGHTAICFVLGSETRDRAVATRIERNRIHDCGRVPATNHDHGIYVEAADGVRIEDNLIYDNADRGVQLYPDARGTYIAHNVMDGNGEGILFAERSSGNLAEKNVITNSKLRWNLESYNLTGTGNEVRFNCLYATNTNAYYNQNGGVDPAIGINVHDSLVSDPMYLDRAAKDFRLKAESPCAGNGPRAG